MGNCDCEDELDVLLLLSELVLLELVRLLEELELVRLLDELELVRLLEDLDDDSPVLSRATQTSPVAPKTGSYIPSSGSCPAPAPSRYHPGPLPAPVTPKDNENVHSPPLIRVSHHR